MNWHERAEALDCYVMARVYDPASNWECYILAENPMDDNEIYCLIVGETIEQCFWTWEGINSCFNVHMERPAVDLAFQSVHVKHIINKLTRLGYEWKLESALSD